VNFKFLKQRKSYMPNINEQACRALYDLTHQPFVPEKNVELVRDFSKIVSGASFSLSVSGLVSTVTAPATAPAATPIALNSAKVLSVSESVNLASKMYLAGKDYTEKNCPLPKK
jgi:hypothetical protein